MHTDSNSNRKPDNAALAYQFRGHEIRVTLLPGEPRFSSVCVAKALGLCEGYPTKPLYSAYEALFLSEEVKSDDRDLHFEWGQFVYHVVLDHVADYTIFANAFGAYTTHNVWLERLGKPKES